MKPANHPSCPTVVPARCGSTNPGRPMLYRLLAIAALWPALALTQEPAPAPETQPAAQPAEAAPATGAEAAPATAATAPAPAADKVEYSKKGADTCLTCHDDAHVIGHLPDAHGQPDDARSPFGKGQLQCEACHGPGGNHTKKMKKGETRPPMIRFDRDSAAPVSVQNGDVPRLPREVHRRAQLARRARTMRTTSPARRATTCTWRRTRCWRGRRSPTCATPATSAERSQFQKPYAHPLRAGQDRLQRLPHAARHHGRRSSSCKSTREPDLLRVPRREARPVPLGARAGAENCDNCHAPHGSTQPGHAEARAARCCASPATRSRATRASPTGRRACPAAGGPRRPRCVLGNCMNCHSQVHGSNHPSGSTLTR